MLPMKFLLFLLVCRVSHCQRRIESGLEVSENKPYVVYFVKASLSDRIYDYWLCGGALITKDFIITSAACVEDVRYLYAIAGYNKYVTQDLEADPCTRKMKKKVIFTCVPVSYEFDFDQLEKWAQIDIALAKVESPYNFKDTAYLEVCSYIPNKIAINYEAKYQTPDTDCMVMGWGHNKTFRKEKDDTNYNSPTLKYTSTLIIDKEPCIKAYEYYPKMAPIIDQYMICTMGNSTINDAGQPKAEVLDIKKYKLLDECEFRRRTGQENSPCIEQNDDDKNTDYNMNARRQVPKTNTTFYNYTTRDYIRKVARERSLNRTRRNGICQNDHGGPLVTWVGTTEVLIGIASVFQIDQDYNCIGPFLHTSTQSNAAFIDCVLKDLSRNRARRNALCDSPPAVRGFDTVENHISWKDHPAGPAENELVEEKFGPSNNNQAPRRRPQKY